MRRNVAAFAIALLQISLFSLFSYLIGCLHVNFKVFESGFKLESCAIPCVDRRVKSWQIVQCQSQGHCAYCSDKFCSANPKDIVHTTLVKKLGEHFLLWKLIHGRQRYLKKHVKEGKKCLTWRRWWITVPRNCLQVALISVLSSFICEMEQISL